MAKHTVLIPQSNKMMRYIVVVFACLSFAAGQESIRGSNAARTLLTVDEDIEKAKALLLKEEEKLQQLEDNMARASGGAVAQADMEDVPEEDLFQLSITIHPGKPCLASNMDQILLAVMRVGFMDFDVCLDDVVEDKTKCRLIEEASHRDEEEAHRLLQDGGYKFASHGCSRCRSKRGRRRRRGTNRARALQVDLPIFRRDLVQDYNSADPLDDTTILSRLLSWKPLRIPNNCLADIMTDDFTLGVAFSGIEP